MYFATLIGNINVALNAITIFVILIVAFYAGRSKIRKDNYNDLMDRVDILDKERDEARVERIENQKAIANLEGQLKTYKEIPLQQIADTLTALSESYNQIMSILKGSSLLSAQDLEVKTTRSVRRK